MLDQIRKYNLWDGNVPELGFLRTNYTDQIHAGISAYQLHGPDTCRNRQ